MKEVFDCLQENYSTFSKLGYKVFGVFLYGSQNFDVSWEESDIDTILIYQSCSKKLPYTRYEHFKHKGLVRLMSIEDYLRGLEQGGHTEYEILFTDYYIVNPSYRFVWKWARENREQLVKENLINHIQSHIDKLNAELEEFGKLNDVGLYDGNRRITRFIHVYCLFFRLFQGNSYKDSLRMISPFKEHILELKKNSLFSEEDCYKIAKQYYDTTYSMAQQYISTNHLTIKRSPTFEKIKELFVLFTNQEEK